MNHEEAITIMDEVLTRFGPYADNMDCGHVSDWDLVFSDNIKVLGLCNLSRRVITINSEYAARAPREAVRDTILHECAHALAGIEMSRNGRRMAHGKHWKMWARRVGANPNATKCTSKLGEFGEDIAANKISKPPKWVVVADRGDHLEKVSEAGRRMKDIGKKLVKGDRSTLGKLWMVERRHWDMYKGNRDKIVGYRLLVR